MSTHRELITALKFDESFRNALRDYYSYGFQGRSSCEAKSLGTRAADWERLNGILKDYLEWSTDCPEGTEKRIRYATADSQSALSNPFHRVYRFCRFNDRDPLVFFNVIFALSGDVELSGGEEAAIWERLGIDLEEQAGRRKRCQYLDFFIQHEGKEIHLTEKKQALILETETGDSVKVLKRDGDFLKRLYRYWSFIHTHTGTVCRQGSLMGSRNGVKERLALPKSSLPDMEMAQKLVEAGGSVKAYKESIYLPDTIEYLEQQLSDLEEDRKAHEGLTASQLQCFYPGKQALFTGDTNGLNQKLQEWERLGILKKAAKEGEALPEVRWKLSSLTLGKLLDTLEKAYPGFEEKFYGALDFFARYQVLGACGSFLMDRMSLSLNLKPAFRFQQDYFMQALNDFNQIDLLDALEKDQWCRIKYRHGTQNFCVELLCRPLELRIGLTTGREYLVYYEPFQRSYTSLRLEFIEEVTCFEEEELLPLFSQSREEIDQELKNARKNMSCSWGIATTESQQDNAVSELFPGTVCLRIAGDSQEKEGIRERLLGEARGDGRVTEEEEGDLVFQAQISSPKEMRPWLRSFYSSIVSCSGMDTEGFFWKEDVKKCRRALDEELFREEAGEPNTWTLSEEKKEQLKESKKGKKAQAHEALFHEIYSIYYYIMAEILMGCSSSLKSAGLSRPELQEIIKKVQGWYDGKKGIWTDTLSAEAVWRLLDTGAFGKREKNQASALHSKYVCRPEQYFYRDILPLTKLEIRWLKTMLSSPKLACFLTEEEIGQMKKLLEEEAPDIAPLPMEKIVFYDRYRIPPEQQERKMPYLGGLLEGIYEEKLIKLSWREPSGIRRQETLRPVLLEFSKKYDRFRICLQSAKEDGQLCWLDPFQIEEVKVTEEDFKLGEALELYESCRKEKERSVELEFYDVRNLADRLLTELSPWKKYCSYSQRDDRYRLKLCYPEMDEAELTARLMGFGADIRIRDREHSISREIRRRLDRQLELIGEEQALM